MNMLIFFSTNLLRIEYFFNLRRIRPRVWKINSRFFFTSTTLFGAVYYTYWIFSSKISKIFCKIKTLESAYFTRVSRVFDNGAGDGNRTRDPHLTKVVLYRWATPACAVFWLIFAVNLSSEKVLFLFYQGGALATESHQQMPLCCF